MPDSLTDWTDRLANLTLPVLPDTAEELDRLAGSPVSSHTNIERILAWDPGYAIAIFRYLGNLPQAPKTPVGTLSHAISLLGSRVVRELARGLSRLEESPRSSPDQETRDCYSRACHASVYAYHWGAQRGDGNPGESGMAALVRRCGEMAMWVHFRAHMVKIRGQVTEGQNADDAARQVLGFTLDQLNQSLALRWTLPPLAVESLSTVGAFKPRPLGVMLAAALADSSSQDWASQETSELLELAAEFLRLPHDQAISAIHCQAVDAARHLCSLPLQSAAYYLIPQAQCQAGEDTAGPPLKIALAATPVAAVRRPSREENTTRPASDLRQKLAQTAADLHTQAGMERTMFAMLSPDRKTLRARFVAGTAADAPLTRFQLHLEQRHLFSLLLTKPNGFWLNQENREKYLPAIPASLQSTINLQGFFVSSLFVGDRPLGILYADRSDPSLANAEDFGRFKACARKLSGELAARAS